jgi:hypothetical protein
VVIRDLVFSALLFAMRYSYVSLALAALATASDVHDLKQDTFKDFIGSNDLVLAECKELCSLLLDRC